MEGDDSAALLQTHNLSVTYESVSGDVRALSDVSFKVGRKEFVAIVGESGAGKSTLALAIIGLLGNASIKGDIIYRGKGSVYTFEEGVEQVPRNGNRNDFPRTPELPQPDRKNWKAN